MKYFVFSDAHGDYDALMEAVKSYGYEADNENHTLISCGDNFGRADRGKGSKGIYEYLTSPVHKNKPICLMGNHELILINILFKRYISANDIFNGEDKTVLSFLGKNPETDGATQYEIDLVSRSEVMDWLLSLPYYFETEHDIFLHGFLPFDRERLKLITENLSSVDEDKWKSACWSETPAMIYKLFSQCPQGLYACDGKEKWIVFGHWHNAQLKYRFDKEIDKSTINSVWRNDMLHLYGLDCCTFESHKVEMLVVED